MPQFKSSRGYSIPGGDGQSGVATRSKRGERIKLEIAPNKPQSKLVTPSGDPVTISSQSNTQLLREAHVESDAFNTKSKKKVKSTYRVFNWIGGVGIIGIILGGCVMGITYSLSHKISDIEWVNYLMAASTSIGLIIGILFLGNSFKGLKAGAFQGIDKWIVTISMGLVFLDEIGGGVVMFNPEFQSFYYTFFAPLMLPYIVLVSKGLELLNTKERRSRKANSVKEKRKHVLAMQEHQIPLQKAKAEEKARQVGSFAAMVHRGKVSFLSTVLSFFSGWGAAISQAQGNIQDSINRQAAFIESKPRKKTASRKAKAKK